LRYAMLTNDREILDQALVDITTMENVYQVQIIGLDGRVTAANNPEKVGMLWQFDDRGCIECHQFPAASRPYTTKLSASNGMLRISKPIANDSNCAGCHVQPGPYLGVLLIDVSVIDIEQRLRHDLRVDLAISMLITLLVTIGVYLLIHWLVVRRVEAFRQPLAEFAAGDFTSRLPSSPAPTDELGELANIFNYMADELKRRAREREERRKLGQRVVAEERRRIARELHDGLAQLLGYVNTKAMAVRLMLQNRQMETAEQTLLQLEDAARGLFVDVREAIVDLKTPSQAEIGLNTTLKDYTAQFTRLNNLPVELTLSPAVENLSLAAETEQQLLRIVQESLTNVRKHAAATRVWVSLQTDGKVLEMMIGDDGKGFNPDHLQTKDRSHFGLTVMSERAKEIGAEFNLDSKPGAGTRVIVRLPLKDASQA
jgi:signal transduction histidine kinase